MSLLTVAQNVAREAGVEVPGQVFGQVNDEIASRLLALTRREGRRLAREHDWVVLRRQAQIAARAGVESYSLPNDYDRILDQTAWDRSNDNPLWGPLTPSQWQFRRSGTVVRSQFNRSFRIMASGAQKALYVDPVPDSVDSLVFEYVSSNWVVSPGGDLQDDFASDDDETILDEELLELGVLWRFLSRVGLSYVEEKAEYEHALERAKARDGGNPAISLAADAEIIMPNMPEGGFGTGSEGSDDDNDFDFLGPLESIILNITDGLADALNDFREASNQSFRPALRNAG
ncbi:hypothetical protein [Salinisphaera sp.]|uniref:phage adaptor protein n=1 Tax=Salinisphaera sp. TaxID=1914330 RepID=UPI000C6927D0|nr:hypothetical protein [Salinisphaera sp.]MAS09921.1 hypothetical protein [Salinisphaera sp.]|tara:strand:+ start:833 stop:1696 length:864 start_codon:yes stop_codon:yes gene_type:complete